MLDGGRVVESGKHSELLSAPESRYAALWKSQHRFGSDGPPPRPKTAKELELEDLLASLEAKVLEK